MIVTEHDGRIAVSESVSQQKRIIIILKICVLPEKNSYLCVLKDKTEV